MVCRPGFENDVNEKIRHSCAHVMADAVTRLFPDAKVTIGPVIDNGFFYDFDYPPGFTPDDLEKIEKEMARIVKENGAFVRKEISRTEALNYFKARGEIYKLEIIDGLPEAESITLYEHGKFTDLCRGPHVDKTGDIKAFKLLSVAGSYWRGDEKKARLQRIYGTAFANKTDLDAYITKLEEAKKRDHRKLGKELGLLSFHEEAPASPFFKPRGAQLYNTLIDYIRSFYKDEGYEEVITPQILDVSLWQRSGHYENFHDNMYFTKIEERDFAVKPMNCPGHCLMFGEKKWSYRELPVRLADFGRLHRFERSGVTHGLTRVRTFCQDDAHIYCTPDQMADEISKFLDLVKRIYDDFGFSDVHLALATRPEKFIGSIEVWDKAEKILADAMTKHGLTFSVNHGEGAFYGPKIEFQVKDALDRAWQLGTLQVDYSMPERFNLEYIDAEQNINRPVMLHRAVLGSIERFLGILIEHTGGKFPFWVAPEQVRLVLVNDDVLPFAREIEGLLKNDFRIECDARNEKLGFKIRSAQMEKVPFMAVIGKKEVETRQISVRHRSRGELGTLSIEAFVDLLKKEKADRNSRD